MKPTNSIVRTAILATFMSFSMGVTYALHISGKILAEKTSEPVAFANVFIANTTFGTLTNKDGEFTLNIPSYGLYQIVVQHLSYITYVSDINLNSDSLFISIRLFAKVRELNTITITSKDPFRKKNIQQFTQAFLGETRNSNKIVIVNPKSIHFYRGFKNRVLSSKQDTIDVALDFIPSYLKAFSDSFLIIRNESLGYILKYKLDLFYQDYHTITFFGYPFFEDLSSQTKNTKRISNRRVQAYYGSKMHFFRSLYNDSLEHDGFQVYRVLEKPRDTSKTYHGKIYYKDYGIMGDLASNKENRLVQTDEKVDLAFYLHSDTFSGIKMLEYHEPFEVRYTEDGEENDYADNRHFHQGIERKKGQQISIVVLKQGKILIARNGSYARISEVTFSGYFGWKRIADLLPFDFNLKQALTK
jgi:hypothetical protein